MHLDSDDLLARIRRDYPQVYKMCELALLVEVQAAEIERLNALVVPGFNPADPRPFLDTEGRHG